MPFGTHDFHHYLSVRFRLDRYLLAQVSPHSDYALPFAERLDSSQSISLERKSLACYAPYPDHAPGLVFQRSAYLGFDTWLDIRTRAQIRQRGIKLKSLLALPLQLESLTIAACVTPTDPVLANV